MFICKHINNYHHLGGAAHQCNVCPYAPNMDVLLGWGLSY